MNVLTIDIGGTAIKYAVMNESKNFLTHGSVPTPLTGREDLVEDIGKLYDAAENCEGIAISMSGIIDSQNGYVVMGGALRYNDDFYFRHSLYERCPVPIYLENDAKCAALAEAANGALKDVPNGIVIILGTMIGGGLIMDHKLYRGSHFSAGEVSYLITDRSGIPAKEGVWGNRCGVPQLCRLYAKRKNLPENEVNGKIVFQAVNAGDIDAMESLREYTGEIAVQIFNLQNIYDPDRFAIGGGISAQPILIEMIQEHLKTLYTSCPYYVRHAEIVTCKFRNDANLYGAYQCFMENIR